MSDNERTGTEGNVLGDMVFLWQLGRACAHVQAPDLDEARYRLLKQHEGNRDWCEYIIKNPPDSAEQIPCAVVYDDGRFRVVKEKRVK